jgi:twitching motility protein PilT
MEYAHELKELIETVIREGGSDLHLSTGSHPTIRVSGSLTPLLQKKPLTKEDTFIFGELLTPAQKKSFLETQETDFSYAYGGTARFRGNAYFQQGGIGIALRLIPRAIRTLEELNLPPILKDFTEKEQGFFLVVGPVGQGKSTTLAALLEMINLERAEHIITIETHEYIFEQKKSLIDQREVKIDTQTFQSALQSVFRQDVDVIMIGEMRNPETIATAVTAAETGHLVFSTLHTNNASQTVERIIDSFPGDQQDQIRLSSRGVSRVFFLNVSFRVFRAVSFLRMNSSSITLR